MSCMSCMYVCMRVCMNACMHAWMDVWMYGCMYACMHVCMYEYVCNECISWRRNSGAQARGGSGVQARGKSGVQASDRPDCIICSRSKWAIRHRKFLVVRCDAFWSLLFCLSAQLCWGHVWAIYVVTRVLAASPIDTARRQENQRPIKTSISCETSSNFHTL